MVIKMKHSIRIIRQYIPWLLLMFVIDAFSVLLLWLADIDAFYSLMMVIVLATVILFSVVCCVLVYLERKREQAFLDFLYTPDEYHEEVLLKSVSKSQREYICLLGKNLRDKQAAYIELNTQLNDYEEYIESWAHEIKIPISLLTLLLDNRRDELSSTVGFKLDYIRSRMQESVGQMLFYARLKSTRKDYMFEHIRILECIEEVLEDYRPLLEEKQFQIQNFLQDDMIYSDRRGLNFILGQVISNSIKYCIKEPELCLASSQRDGCYVLFIKDNGTGVRNCDLPYIFEKGFTGDPGEGRKSATGMGLYLAKEMAKELNIDLNASSQWGQGFEMEIDFPVVNG